MLQILKYLILVILLAGCSASIPNSSPTVFREVTGIRNYKGLDILGAARQDTRNIVRHLPPDTSVGVLEGTFGPVIPTLKAYLDTGNVPMFRGHLANYTCIRNRNCAAGEIKITDYNALGRRAAAFEAVAKQYPAVKCFLSPWLEYDVVDRAIVNRWVQTVKDNAPSCEIVMSPYKGWVPPGMILEKHGNNAKADIISNDGESFFDSNTDLYLNGSKFASFAWWNRCNLRTSGEKTWTTPMKRVAKIQTDELNQVNYLLKNRATPKPVFRSCPRAKTLTSPSIWKVRSEDYNTKDVRENKAVLIVKGVFSKGFVLSNPAGKTVGCLKYYGAYSGLKGYYRYYIGNCSGQAPYRLMQDAGSEWVCAKNGNTQFALSAVRRSGTFR